MEQDSSLVSLDVTRSPQPNVNEYESYWNAISSVFSKKKENIAYDITHIRMSLFFSFGFTLLFAYVSLPLSCGGNTLLLLVS